MGQPPRTGAALGELELRWREAAEAMQEELSTLGQIALAASFLYTMTDEDVIPGVATVSATSAEGLP